MELYHGNIVYSGSREDLVQFPDSYIAVQDGIVEGIYPKLPEKFAGIPVTDYADDVIIPAFSDLHVHAPQYPQRGTAMDALLHDWLHSYTFPLESRYADLEYARAVYDAFVEDMILHGTMHAVVFGTIHREASGCLIERMEKAGLRALVGKVNMDMDSPEYLCETVEESLRETEAFLEQYMSNRTAKPILTPRFAPTCSQELMNGLGTLAKKYGTGLQTHLVESKWEAAQAKADFPDVSCDTQIYEKAGLMENGPVVAAHFIFPSEEDIRILKAHGGYAVQCPDATINVIAGIMRNSDLAARGVNLALGSDIAGGHKIGIYTQAAKSVQLSKIREFYEPEGNRAIGFEEAFYMATKQGGEIFGKVGSFEKGYRFDAIVIDALEDPFMKLTTQQVVERFCYCGTKENTIARYLGGERI